MNNGYNWYNNGYNGYNNGYNGYNGYPLVDFYSCTLILSPIFNGN